MALDKREPRPRHLESHVLWYGALFVALLHVKLISTLVLIYEPDLQLIDIVASLTLAGPPILDPNSRASVEAVGVSNVVFTIDEVHNRSSVYNRLTDVQSEATLSGSLQFLLDTLATKVLLCNESNSTSNGTTAVRAYGVQVVEGAGLPVASNFHRAGETQELQTRNITARREVIISAGTFQSPQLVCSLFCIFVSVAHFRPDPIGRIAYGRCKEARPFALLRFDIVISCPGLEMLNS